MIKYSLICESDHEFEGWFRDSADFDSQAADGLLEMPDVRQRRSAESYYGAGDFNTPRRQTLWAKV